MTKEMEFAKCIALLRKALRMELLTEAEYVAARNKLMDIYISLFVRMIRRQRKYRCVEINSSHIR